MKPDKSRRSQPESSNIPDRLYPSGKFSIHDPRLSAMARRPDASEKKRKSQIGARISTIICVTLSLVVIVAVLLPMLLGKEPGVSDVPPNPSPDLPPDDDPDLSPDEPVDPPVDEPEPPVEEWVTGRLDFSMNTFLRLSTLFLWVRHFFYKVPFPFFDVLPCSKQKFLFLSLHLQVLYEILQNPYQR